VKFGLIGDPVAHSLSPVMHASAYRALGMRHTYQAHQVTAAEVGTWVQLVRTGEIWGLNVTVPHKEAVLPFVDRMDESARAVRAANTLANKNGAVVAYNTDVPALAAEVSALAPELTVADWAGATGVILGSGGTARSAVASLAMHLKLRRLIVRARAFADDASCTQFRKSVADVLGTTELVLEPLAPRAAPEEPAVMVVVQATSAGMTGKEGGEAVASAVSFSSLSARAVALDVIYAPPRTPFIAEAQRAGIRVGNGLGMLARQGALSFEIWLGVPAPYNAMLSALL
jgi:shikimate dehydrogenase